MRLKLASQAKTGWLTAAFPGQAHEGLQQSQYLVDLPEPDAAWAVRGSAASSEVLKIEVDRILDPRIREDWVDQREVQIKSPNIGVDGRRPSSYRRKILMAL